jgi:autoinducer 2 (AI-2) kinase
VGRAAEYLLTLDAGTGSGRCVAFDAAGRPVAAAQERFQYRIRADLDLPFVRGFDLDPHAFWGVLARCAREVMAALPAPAQVAGVIATSQREGCVLVDHAGEVLYAGPNLDSRAVVEGMEVLERVGAERLHAVTGHSPPYIFAVARYLWFRKHGDEARVGRLLMLNDWITYLLSGEQVAEHSNAGESMLYDVSRREWSSELLDTLGIPGAILPPLCGAGTRVGRVTDAAATATGIPAGTPVFAGGADTESALLGSGVHEHGQTGAVLGTTAPVQMVTERPIIDPHGTLWTSCHVVPDRWVLESNGGDSGGAYRWLLELMFGGSGPAEHAAAEKAMEGARPAERQLFCNLGPVIFNLQEMSPFRPAALLFRFPLLHIDRPERGEILRSYVESIAFAIRGNCEQVTAASGREIPLLTVSGGMTQSPILIRILANTLGIPLAIASVPESASLGSAMLVAVGTGIHASIPDAVTAMARAGRVEPEPGETAAYDERYRRWRELYDTLKTWSL